MKEKLKFPIVVICSLFCLDILGCSLEYMDECLCSPKVETLGEFPKIFGKYGSGDAVMFEHSTDTASTRSSWKIACSIVLRRQFHWMLPCV